MASSNSAFPPDAMRTSFTRAATKDLPGAWTALKKEWLPKSGHRMSGPSYEVYLNDPMSTPKAELLTEIYMRLQ